MDKRNYIKEYEKYSGLFKKHFGENADIYWKMYLNYHVDVNGKYFPAKNGN